MISTLLPNPFCTPAYVTSPSAIEITSAWCVPAKSIPVCFFTSPVVGCTLVPYADVIVYVLFNGFTKFCVCVAVLFVLAPVNAFACDATFDTAEFIAVFNVSFELAVVCAGGFGFTHCSFVFVFP